MSKSDKLYKDSPVIKKDADGKPGIQKPSGSDERGLDLEGGLMPPDIDGMPIDIKQVKDMHERHITEMKDMHKRHQKEHEKLASDHTSQGHTNDVGEETKDKEGSN